MAEYIDRRALKTESKALLADAQVSPKAMTALYMGLILALNLVDTLTESTGIIATFVTILTSLLVLVLNAGFALYCMAVRRGERAEFLTLFDGFSFVGKLIALNIVIYLFIFLWSMLFVVPGIIASYRYRFALYNLYENPDLGILEALNLSKRQTFGYKGQLFMLDLSYFGWSVLSLLPTLIYDAAFYQEMFRMAADSIGVGTISAVTMGAAVTTLLPAAVWTLIMGLWQLVVSLFYYPSFVCTDLSYFEIAKRTSGTGAGTSNQTPPWRDGPDNMGGF